MKLRELAFIPGKAIRIKQSLLVQFCEAWSKQHKASLVVIESSLPSD